MLLANCGVRLDFQKTSLNFAVCNSVLGLMIERRGCENV